MLMEYVTDAIVLDLFAGSGAIGIEALSRGAETCYFCDINKECIKVINENIEKARFKDQSIIFNLDYKKALNEVRDIKFDIVYIDPPYNNGLGQDAIEIISSYDLLKKDGVLVFETDEVEESPETIGKYVKFKSKKYGRNILNFYSSKGELA